MIDVKWPEVKPAKQPKKFYVAVILDSSRLHDVELVHSKRENGDWAAFVGTSRVVVSERASEVKRKWEATGQPGWGPYVVLTGELTAKVKETVTRKAVKL